MDRLPRRPGAPLRGRTGWPSSTPSAAPTRRSCGRSSSGAASHRRGRPARPTRSIPAIASPTWTSSSATPSSAGMEVLMTIWGTPKWANGGKGPAYLPTKMADFQNFAQRARDPLLRPPPRLPVRALLRDLERVQPRQLPRARSSTRRARSSARPPTRSWRPPATPGSRPAARRRSSRSARPRRTARTSRSRARPTRPRRARSRSWSRRRTRSSSSTPGRSTRIPCRSTRGRRRRCATRTSPSAR